MHLLEQKKSFKRKRNVEKENHSESKRFRFDRPKGQHGEIEKKTPSNMCQICSENHPVHKCPKFLKMNISYRKKSIREHELCMNFLKPHHVSKDCYSGACSRCNSKHNSLLCFENPANRIVATMQKTEGQRKKGKKMQEERKNANSSEEPKK